MRPTFVSHVSEMQSTHIFNFVIRFIWVWEWGELTSKSSQIVRSNWERVQLEEQDQDDDDDDDDDEE